MEIKIILDEMAKMPTKAHETDAGFDLYSPVHCFLPSGESITIDTGVRMEIPMGYFGAVRGRSGMAFKSDVTAFDGTLDAYYLGTIGVKLYNHSNKMVSIERGDRIAQVVILPIPKVELVVVDKFAESERGANGYGSTGK